jgi:hypothetical protein
LALSVENATQMFRVERTLRGNRKKRRKLGAINDVSLTCLHDYEKNRHLNENSAWCREATIRTQVMFEQYYYVSKILVRVK